METDTLIVGGGLAGLSLASLLQAAGRDYQLVEARTRLGGRIKTELFDNGYFDMGPAWFWPGQPRIAALVSELGLSRFDQHAAGDLMFEDPTGEVQRGRGYASMQGSYRLVGGLQALVTALASQIPENRLATGTEVTRLERKQNGIAATFADGRDIDAKKVVLALPPRIAKETISFGGELSESTLHAMSQIPTWMAGQAKALAVYDTAFWRDDGLSGDAMSRRGPMVEIHDASPAEGGPYALFGFIGLPAHARQDQKMLKSLIISQLGRLFGPAATKPRALYLKDWAHDRFSATELDQVPVYAHPQYGLPSALSGLWNNRLHFGSTEIANGFGGYLEGALEAAELTAQTLLNDKR
ncbi:NAD(P)/FAD-dependent oxidoreductase [uncultured Litoreibacter sp.]|uniref:flavin monoamine oxidase family protein n=1 Tax=uncultured Litoreibacter sp. TaxID=1392394 RepID=UPI00261B07A5|nr:NAD(P)/FAD-dependent oxidoreductase [uncultured Litoreibacter sp.]